MIKERQSNFELLRIVCILLILTMHSISQVQVSELSTFNVYLSHIVSSIGNIGVSCFLLISGYFGIKFKLQRFIQLAFLTTLYAVVVYLFQKGFVVDRGIVKALLVVPLYDNWFVSCYLLLALFAPYLNDFVQNLSKIQYAKLLVIMIYLCNILHLNYLLCCITSAALGVPITFLCLKLFAYKPKNKDESNIYLYREE